MPISKKIQDFMQQSSWIRKMFEQGTLLKNRHGVENVFDFSLGNPNIKPPESFSKTLKLIASDNCSHSYMPNNGFIHVRKAVSDYLEKEQGVHLTANDIIMTCGAAGGLNVILKTILNPEEEVITPAPYFVEYNFYVDNHGGVLKTVNTKPDFTLDNKAIEKAITKKTKAVLINFPNNPTGRIYSKESLNELCSILRKKSLEMENTIFLISDEPYRKIVYDNYKVPSIFNSYEESILTTSYSKDISIPGERIGFIAVNSASKDNSDLISGMTLANRILGFVNAPALMQLVLPYIQGHTSNISIYAKNRDILCQGLAKIGYEFIKPEGAFYLFVKSPVQDDTKFVNELQKELILTVPGTGFGCSGYFRIAFCVDEKVITGALNGFKRTFDKFK